MFFSPDLLSKRDSGFGLLWLAATLGSKSAFKKLPKRSVMTADISQLCQLIATPVEPLALRLSSNLLVGAARVYRVKQEILMSDVTTCYNSLKRVEHELRSVSSSEAQLQMAQPSVKSAAVTLRADPRVALSMDFDAMITNWDDYLNPQGKADVEGDSDNDYNPGATKGKRKAAATSTHSPNFEFLRATACTLSENHDFLLANSIDVSFGGSGAINPSSSQFGFDDTFDGLDIEEGVGDDFVRELGEGWGGSPVPENVADFTQVPEPFATNFDARENWDDGIAAHDMIMRDPPDPQPDSLANSIQNLHIDAVEPPRSPSPLGETVPLLEPAVEYAKTVFAQQNNGVMSKKAKRTRPLLDVRTELTDEELRATRSYYMDRQNTLRFELELKRFEKMQGNMIYGLLWDAPGSVQAKELVDFWVDHFKAHVEARSGLFVEPQCLGSPYKKRRKVSISPLKPHRANMEGASMWFWPTDEEALPPVDADANATMEFNHNVEANWGDLDDYSPHRKNQRSSEEPGQARRASHASPAPGDNIDADVVSDPLHSQRSALFPWDMAGSNSSIAALEGGIQLLSNEPISIEHADARLRASSASRRGSSAASLINVQAGSPAVILRTIQSEDDFIFDVPGDGHPVPDARQSEASRIVLEKNSHNFLEYTKMQYKSLPSAQYLLFDDVVPKATSTARVAAAALYHCLVLTTKDLLQVKQEEAYGWIEIRIA